MKHAIEMQNAESNKQHWSSERRKWAKPTTRK